MMGKVHHDLGGLEARMRLYPREVMAASMRAKNRAAASTRTQAGRAFATLYPNLPRRALLGQLRLTRATAASPKASLSFSGKRLRLYGNFGARQTRSGVKLTGGRVPWRVETLDGTPVQPGVLRHAFVQRSRQGGSPQVWVRVGGSRYPITALLASSLSRAFKNREVGSNLLIYGRARFRAAFAQEMKYRIGRKTRSA